MLQKWWDYPAGDLSTTNDNDPNTCVQLPALAHSHRLNIYISKQTAAFDVNINTNDSSGLCPKAKLFVPLNRFDLSIVQDEACEKELQYAECPLQNSGDNTCTYTCDHTQFGVWLDPVCSMLYLRISPLATAVQLCEITLTSA